MSIAHRLIGEAYSGFNAEELNSNQPVPSDAAAVYRTMHQPWAEQIARRMRKKFGINLWMDGTVTTGWRILVHRDDYERARNMFLSSI